MIIGTHAVCSSAVTRECSEYSTACTSKGSQVHIIQVTGWQKWTVIYSSITTSDRHMKTMLLSSRNTRIKSKVDPASLQVMIEKKPRVRNFVSGYGIDL